jgi:streptomycin 6-kinase
LGRPFERSLLERGLAALYDLGPAQGEPVLLHQDLHGGNVLRSGRGWLAIDPKPLAAEPAFDCASLIRDRRPELLKDPHPARTLNRRLATLSAALDLDEERVRAWAIAHALAWGIEQEAVHPSHLACAEWLARGT